LLKQYPPEGGPLAPRALLDYYFRASGSDPSSGLGVTSVIE
jgi:hypothetical protein